ncbi:MAG: SIMPL domain-containing protein [Treponema sp.]|nr:SIMPL domain-containing protein [Treponema sp.]
MKKVKLLAAVLISLAALTSCTINKPQEVTRKITVKGFGTVNVDQINLTFSVKTREMNQNTAAEENSNISSVVNEILVNAGIDAKDISVSGNKVTTEKGPKVWVKQDDGEWVGLDDYFTVINTIQVAVKDVTKAKAIKDAVIQSNSSAVSLTDAKYIPGDFNSSVRQARILAVQNAQDSANLLAGASGCKVNNVLEITEEATVNEKANAKALLQETMPGAISTVSNGNINVTTNVTITYTLMD